MLLSSLEKEGLSWNTHRHIQTETGKCSTCNMSAERFSWVAVCERWAGGPRQLGMRWRVFAPRLDPSYWSVGEEGRLFQCYLVICPGNSFSRWYFNYRQDLRAFSHLVCLSTPGGLGPIQHAYEQSKWSHTPFPAEWFAFWSQSLSLARRIGERHKPVTWFHLRSWVSKWWRNAVMCCLCDYNQTEKNKQNVAHPMCCIVY